MDGRHSSFMVHLSILDMRRSMDTGGRTLENISKMERFNAWMARVIDPFVGQRVLEVGAGIGNLTQFFVNRQFVMASDVEDQYVDVLQQKFGAYGNFRCRRLDLMEEGALEFKIYDFDTIICLNVLEHILDDRRALQTMFDILLPKGNLVLLVPAFQWLYGSLDVRLNHYRRYSRSEVSEKLSNAGFTLRTIRWMNMFGIFGWYLNARIRKVPSLPEAQLRLYDRLVPFFQLVEGVLGPPFGQSIIAVGKKRG